MSPNLIRILQSQHLMCAPPFYETPYSAMLVWLVPSQLDQKDILKFICNQYILCIEFILYMDVLVLQQRGKLKSPEYHKLTKIKNSMGQNSLSHSNIPFQLLPFLIAEQWVHFPHFLIFQPHVEKHGTQRSTSDVALIMTVAIMSILTKTVTNNTDPTAAALAWQAS